MLSATNEEFLDHLADCLDLDDQTVPRPGRWFEAGNTIGMLALRLNLLNVEQIEGIVEQQQSVPGRPAQDDGQLFGEIAVQLGFLTSEQVARLLEIQCMNRQLELGQQLVATGKLSVPGLAQLFHKFVNN